MFLPHKAYVLSEIVSILEQAYAKFEAAVSQGSENFLAHDYWGLALFTHAKLLKPQTPGVRFPLLLPLRLYLELIPTLSEFISQSDAMYEQCFEQFRRAHAIKSRDGYILCHWGSAIQQQASVLNGLSSS